jgi:hypothetical protein
MGGPKKRAWLRLAASLILTTPVLMGYSECEQSSPDATCDTDCASGEIVICGNKCVTPRTAGQTCSLKACDASSMCESGLSCMDDGSGVLRCQDAGYVLGAECPPSGADECANNLYCRDNVKCGETHPDLQVGRCATPVLEGNDCDSNIDQPKCHPCAPGLGCDNGVCQRPCQDSGDCGCDKPGTNYECKSSQCVECQSAGNRCDGDYNLCCGKSKCQGKDAYGVSTCCMPPNEGNACKKSSQCCGDDSVCAPTGSTGTGVCQTCHDLGDSCANDAQCCGSTSCKGGKCIHNCDSNKACTASGEQGECRNGKTACDDLGNDSCEPAQPSPESCDGKDNDCDGDVDEVEGGSCSDPEIIGAECQPGFQPPKTLLVCDQDGEPPVCVAMADDFCTTCGGECGGCQGNSCSQSNGCAPGLACIGVGGSPDQCVPDNTCPDLWCWTPADVGQCGSP